MCRVRGGGGRGGVGGGVWLTGGSAAVQTQCAAMLLCSFLEPDVSPAHNRTSIQRVLLQGYGVKVVYRTCFFNAVVSKWDAFF